MECNQVGLRAHDLVPLLAVLGLLAAVIYVGIFCQLFRKHTPGERAQDDADQSAALDAYRRHEGQ